MSVEKQQYGTVEKQGRGVLLIQTFSPGSTEDAGRASLVAQRAAICRETG